VTVLLSSHILAEVQQVCRSVSIIGNGRLLASGEVDSLVGDRAEGTTRVVLDGADAAADRLREAGLEVSRDGEAVLVQGVADPADVTRLLAEDGMYVREITRVRQDLESVFLQLTKDDTLHTEAAAVAGKDGAA
jgi:ABC-2 type transport system ATP-binding protein